MSASHKHPHGHGHPHSHQHQQQQPASRRLRQGPHDGAAALYGEMSLAAGAAAARTSPNPAAAAAAASATAQTRSSRPSTGPSPATHPSLSPVTAAVGLSASATTTTTTTTATNTNHFSSASSPSNSLSVSTSNNAGSSAGPAPLFYVHPIAPAAVRSIHSLSNQQQQQPLSHLRVNNTPLEPDSSCGSSTVGRNSPASSTSASPSLCVSASAAAAASNSIGGGVFLSGAGGNSSSSGNNCSGSLATPPSSNRGSSVPSAAAAAACSGNHGTNGNGGGGGGIHAAASAAAAAFSGSPVYIRHMTSPMSAGAPWMRLHRGSAASANANSTGMRKGSFMVPGSGGNAGSTMPASITAAGVAGTSTASGGGTPRLSSATPAVPGTPLASLEALHNAAVAGGCSEDDAAAYICQICLHHSCICGASSGAAGGGRDGNGGLGGISLSSCRCTGGAGVPWAAALALQRQQQQLLGTTGTSTMLSSFPAAAASTAVPLSLVPPFRTARVEAAVYRGAYPVLRNFPYLRRLHLRTIVSLIPEPPTYDLKCFAEAEHIQLHHIHAERSKGEVQLLPSELSEALQLIINQDMHPVYVHCLDGRHVTGLVIMGLRKLQQWDIKASHAEYMRFTREEQDEVPFIADYTGPLLVPPHIPAWLWGGSLYDPATGQPKRLMPSTMRLRLSTTVTAGVAAAAGTTSATAGGGADHASATQNASAGTADAASGAAAASRTGGVAVSGSGATAAGANGSSDPRSSAAAPWMSIPNAQVVASDGQLYVDVDRVRGAAALYNTPGAHYSNVPMLFSFEYAASPRSTPTVHSSGTAAASPGPSVSNSNTGSFTRRGLAASTKNQTTSASRPASQPNTANNSMPALPPAVPAAAAISGVAAPPPISGGGGGSGGGSSSSSRWVMAAPLDVLQPSHTPLHLHPPSPVVTGAAATPQQLLSPTPSNASSGTNTDVGSGGNLFDSQLSALLWTSGLTAPPAAVGKSAGASGGSGLVGGAGSSSVSGGAGGTVGGSSGGVAGSGAAALLGPRKGIAAGGVGASASSRAAKRSYSR